MGSSSLPSFTRRALLRPVRVVQSADRSTWTADALAGLTVTVILLPQAIAFALIAGLPPSVGLYTAIVGAVVGALWGSSPLVQNGPTSAVSLLVLSTLAASFPEGAPGALAAAGLLAVMAGVLQIGMGFARLEGLRPVRGLSGIGLVLPIRRQHLLRRPNSPRVGLLGRLPARRHALPGQPDRLPPPGRTGGRLADRGRRHDRRARHPADRARGVQYRGGKAETQSMALRCETHTRRIIYADHALDDVDPGAGDWTAG